MKKRRFKGFTLIEMLVVVAIILVLGALLFPALNKGLESGRNTRCVSNLRQLQLGSFNYASQGGSLPFAESSWQSDGLGGTFHQHGWVAWYDKSGALDVNGSGGAYAWNGANGYSSITNGALWGYVKSADVYLCPTFALKSVSGLTDAKCSYAMVTNMFVSGANILGMQGATTVLYCDDNNVRTNAYDPKCGTNEVGVWHRGKGNVVYLDGHVERQ